MRQKRRLISAASTHEFKTLEWRNELIMHGGVS